MSSKDEIVLGFNYIHPQNTVVQKQIHDFYEIVYYKTGDGVMEQDVIPNVKSVISRDICESDDIHPRTKDLLSKRISDLL